MKSSLPRQRPKRAGDDYLRHELSASASQDGANKKQRFDYRNPSTLAAEAPDEDPILDLDEIGAKSAQVKRNAVELDGYGSDSSNDNFDTRAAVKAKKEEAEKASGKAKSKEEDDADMFADLDEKVDGGSDDEGLGREGKRKKKEVQFLEEKDIEGQVAGSKSGGHVSADFTLGNGKKERDADAESSSEESVDDDERGMAGDGEDDEELGAGSKKKHAPKLDAFNMANEAEEGKFDESGNFIRKAADPYAVHDSWLDGSSKLAMRKAREAHEKREEDRRRRDIADDALSTSQILSTLISRLRDEETVLEALARLGNVKDKKKPKFQKNKRKSAAGMNVDKPEDRAEAKRKEAVETITAAADQLMTRGQTEIYEAERALLMRQYRRETGEEWKVEYDEMEEDGEGRREWEYRWADARDGGESHGPYDGNTMKAWNEAGYFGEGVEFKEVGKEGWRAAVDFV